MGALDGGGISGFFAAKAFEVRQAVKSSVKKKVINLAVTASCFKESVKQGAVDLIDDAASFKHSVDEIADDREAEKAEKKKIYIDRISSV